MIARLTGKLLDKKAPILTVDVNGVGYELFAPMETFYQLPELNHTITLYTQLVVREDAHTLYGFHDAATKELFKRLIKINGVGPKVALAILSGIAPNELVACVQAQEHKRLTKIPGVGPKMAQRLTLELKDKLNDWGGDGVHTQVALEGAKTDNLQEASDALMALGYKPQDIKRMLNKADENATAEDLIRQALKSA